MDEFVKDLHFTLRYLMVLYQQRCEIALSKAQILLELQQGLAV